MKFEDFIKNGNVRRSSKDESLVKSLIRNSKKDLKFLDKIKIDANSSRKLMANYYDVLRSILEAMVLLKKYKVYSHEAFTYFLKENGEEIISIKFDRFRKIRNSINYYGGDITMEDAKENILEIQKIIKYLLSKYFN